MPRVKSASEAEVVLYTWGASLSPAIRPVPHFTFDLSAFRDPIGNAYFRNNYPNGTAAEVITWLKADKRIDAIAENLLIHIWQEWAGLQSPTSVLWFTAGLWDHMGKWIAPAAAEAIADIIAAEDWNVWTAHFSITEAGKSGK